MGTNMKTSFTLLALVLLGGAAGAVQAAPTGIAQLPLLNITGTGAVKPNLMLLYDNSGSMASNYTPDNINDSTTCRAAAQMTGGTMSCAMGHPPFASGDFNKQYYNPAVNYTPPVKADGTSYNSLNRANTSTWSVVTTDGFGINTKNMLGSSTASTNLVTGYPDVKWCDGGGNCGFNSATYTYPDNAFYNEVAFNTNAYYYTINVAEYCTDANMTSCIATGVGASAPNGYPVPAKVRWCDSTALTNCQSKYVGTFIYPRFSNPNSGMIAAYGTITIGSSSGSNALSITSASVGESGGPVVITNTSVAAATGTNLLSKRAAVANALAASIIAKTGLTRQYTACVRTPTGSVPACSSYGITLAQDDIVAVIPIACSLGATDKSLAQCAVVGDNSRSGWPLSVVSPTVTVTAQQESTALVNFSGKISTSSNATLASLKLGTKELISSTLTITKNISLASTVAAIVTKINNGTNGTITAYAGGNAVTLACAAQANTSLCLVDTGAGAAAGGLALTMGAWTNKNTLSWTLVSSTAKTAAVTDAINFAATPSNPGTLGSGGAVFTRTDIVSTRASYPKGSNRTDCVGASCTYDEEMTNFANWYGYYKTRNQMMKTAVGQAFGPINSNYQVGVVSLSNAAAGNAMILPKPFTGADRTTWYSTLYAMNGSSSTPLRAALHAVGKMYANLSPYVAAAGSEVVKYPCQQNFTFMTTDGYWNGSAAATVTSNDEAASTTRFCSLASGCVDARAQSTYNSLADVALYWYNGGSNTTNTSLRTSLEDYTKPGLVPAAAGENTRLHMNTYTLGLGVDGVMHYEANYDKTPIVGGDFYNLITRATSGCPWNSNGAYVWPDPHTSDSSNNAYQERVDDLWHAAVNGHGKYFSASDPSQVVGGLQAALNNIATRVGAAAAAATSTPNISQQDNDIFSDTFTTVKWYGELVDKKIDTVTGIVGSTAVWNSSDLLGRKVAAASDTRVIKMLDTTTGGLKDFTYASLAAGLEQGWFNNKCSALAQCIGLSTSDKAIVNAGTNIVNWLRGQQQYADDALLRAYSQTANVPSGLTTTIPIVLGDIASSKPAFLREPRKSYTLAGYDAFKVQWTTTTPRTATVFAAANDGMLHAFNATSGEEMWAYMPRIVMSKLHLQASTTYGTNHQFSADGSPEVGDVQIGGAWKTVLVAGLNGGGRGYYALDVTDPTAPVALWELCADPAICAGALHDDDLGLSFGNPQFGTWRDSGGTSHWVVFVTSGYNNLPGTDGVATAAATGRGYLFIIDVATGQVLSKTSTGSGDTTTPSGLAKITAISANPVSDPLVTTVYGGDNLGQMWRFSFAAAGAPTLIKMGDAGALQPITTRPDVTTCKVGTGAAAVAKVVVVFGTGRLLDVGDVTNTDQQSAYVLKDDVVGITAGQWRNTSSMTEMALTRLSGSNVNSYTIAPPTGGAAVDLATKKGWWVDFELNSGERVNLDPKIVAGGLNVVTNLPSSTSACAVGGTSNIYQLNVCTGVAIDTNGVTGDDIAGTTLSNTSAAVGFIIIRLPSGALKMVTTLADGNTITSGVAPVVTLGTRKAGWRRVKN
jgi:type IV pilus assembly protein PilY1